MSASEPPSLIVDGLRFPPMFTEENVKSAQNYRPRDDDVIVVTYPKCGTTWTQVILSLIFTQGDPEGAKKLFASSPFLEHQGSKEAETLERPCILKTHLPFGRAPWSDKAKYICVSRNPKDCCVSYFHHYKVHHSSLDFDHFFEMFIEGRVNFGDYFDYLKIWEEQRKNANILFLTYEEMKEDTKAAILKMASFLDDEKYGEALRGNGNILNDILKYSSPENTKEFISSHRHGKVDQTKLPVCKGGMKHGKFAEGMKSDSQDNEPDSTHLKGSQCNKHVGIDNILVRKAIVGDWRNQFSEEQSRRLDQKILERTIGSDFVNLHIWKKYM
ncbi:hypothetical protein JTE90_028313 [Oedothorax gibbosus]|uniref:Sulfotransferase domain-containing protein n=1 Tax=Oedothorax gibbosus TaxID=931172 RepID=A0AAV6TZN9_9ARAC|nr:hypothetical protein JTE90_028313 [Oedothorax gibbosus]